MRQTTPSRKRKAAKPVPFKNYALMLACGLLLVTGFFFAGRQHFSTMDYGMKNARLRKQVDELENEKRRLLLAREVSLSPAEIKKAVRKAGMAGRPERLSEMAQVASTTRDKAAPPAVNSKPLVVKTAAVAPAAVSRAAAVYEKKAKTQKSETAAMRVSTSAE